MKLSKIAILALRGLSPEAKEKIAIAIGVTMASIYRFIQNNEDNGSLTKAAAVNVIHEETGLPFSEILEEVKEVSNEQR